MANIITSNVSDIPIKDKQLIFDTAESTIYLDTEDTRHSFGGKVPDITGVVKTVNGKEPDSAGNLALNAEDVGADEPLNEVDLDSYFVNDGECLATLQGGNYYKSFTGKIPSTEYIFDISGDKLKEILVEIDLSTGDPADPSSWVYVTFPANLRWVNEPELTPGKWLIAICNGIAVAAEVEG